MMSLLTPRTAIIVPVHAVLRLEASMVNLVDTTAAYIVAVASGYSLCAEHGHSTPGDIVLSMVPPPRVNSVLTQDDMHMIFVVAAT